MGKATITIDFNKPSLSANEQSALLLLATQYCPTTKFNPKPEGDDPYQLLIRGEIYFVKLSHPINIETITSSGYADYEVTVLSPSSGPGKYSIENPSRPKRRGTTPPPSLGTSPDSVSTSITPMPGGSPVRKASPEPIETEKEIIALYKKHIPDELSPTAMADAMLNLIRPNEGDNNKCIKVLDDKVKQLNKKLRKLNNQKLNELYCQSLKTAIGNHPKAVGNDLRHFPIPAPSKFQDSLQICVLELKNLRKQKADMLKILLNLYDVAKKYRGDLNIIKNTDLDGLRNAFSLPEGKPGEDKTTFYKIKFAIESFDKCLFTPVDQKGYSEIYKVICNNFQSIPQRINDCYSRAPEIPRSALLLQLRLISYSEPLKNTGSLRSEITDTVLAHMSNKHIPRWQAFLCRFRIFSFLKPAPVSNKDLKALTNCLCSSVAFTHEISPVVERLENTALRDALQPKITAAISGLPASGAVFIPPPPSRSAPIPPPPSRTAPATPSGGHVPTIMDYVADAYKARPRREDIESRPAEVFSTSP